MKASTITLMIFAIAILTGGCVSITQKLIPSTDPSVRTNFFGFSIQPPDGQGWFVQEQGSLRITYTKITKRKEKHTVLAMAMSQAVDQPLKSKKELLEYVERTEKTIKTDSRFEAVNQRISVLQIDHAECVRVDFTADDHSVPFAFGATYILQGFDIICLHPFSSHILIRFGVSQRFEKGKTPLMLENEINASIKSLSFDERIQNRFSIGPLMGMYRYDKFLLFPDGRNWSKERSLLSAVKEGVCKKTEIYMSSTASERVLAMEYDMEWATNASILANPNFGLKPRPDLGCILGKVGRWKEALVAFRIALKANPQSAEIRGNIGVAAHVVGRFKESVEYFTKAKTLKPGYFNKRIHQKQIFSASEQGISVFRD